MRSQGSDSLVAEAPLTIEHPTSAPVTAPPVVVAEQIVAAEQIAIAEQAAAAQQTADAPRQPKERVAWVDIAKGLSILLVVLLHSTDMLVRKEIASDVWVTFNSALQPIRMPLFFVASGLFAQGLLKMEWAKMLRSRTAHLFYLYFLWTAIFVGAHNLLPQETAHGGYAQFQSIIHGIYIPSSALWFIYGLAIFGVAAKAMKNVPLVGQFAIAIALNITAQYVTIVNFGWNNLAEYFVYFLVGMHFRSIVVKVAKHNSTAWIAVSIAAYAGAGALYGMVNGHGGDGLKILVSSTGLVAGVLIASRLAGTQVGNVFNYVGKNTIGIYLMFDIMIAIVVFGLIKIPHLAMIPGFIFVSPLLVLVTVALMALGTKKALVAANQHWLFELPPVLRGTAKKA